MLMKGMLDESTSSNRGEGGGRDTEMDAQLELWERRWIHHLQRSLGVSIDAAFPGTASCCVGAVAPCG